jgi:YgiT-type zinc finger domain-containing protein
VTEIEIEDNMKIDWIREKVREAACRFSEHVVRSLVTGKISFQEITAALSNGQIIEIHRNPKRADSFLILGLSNAKPVHVMCADGDNDCLVVLFAYIPTPPVWDTPKKRRTTGGNRMSPASGYCFFCGGELKEITVGNFDYRLEGQLYVIKNVPAGLCQQCGEKYITAEAAQRISGQIETGNYTGTEAVHILEY